MHEFAPVHPHHHRHVAKGFRLSRFSVLLTSFLMLLINSLLATSAVLPSTVAAQSAPGELDSKALYDSSAGPVFTLPPWTDASGWEVRENYATIQLADINGDGHDELLGRGNNGMSVQEWDTTLGLWNEISGSGPFTNKQGWDHPQFALTIQTADIDGDGAAELLGRSATGMETFKWDGTNWKLLKAEDPYWADKNGWDAAKYYSTIQTADIDGDGADELLARGVNGMDTYKWTDGEWKNLKSGSPPWSDAAGWDKVQYYSTIQTADIDGDGAEELLVRAAGGMDTYKWTGSEWKYLKGGSPPWLDAYDWDDSVAYRTIQTGDLDGDGKAELIARSVDWLEVYTWTDGEWKTFFNFLAHTYWPTYQGWNNPGYYLTIQSADIDGEKGDELLIRNASGMLAYKWNPTSKLLDRIVSDNPKLADDYWADGDNYLTIQTGDVDGDGAADLIARGVYGIRTWSYNKVTAKAWDYPAKYGLKVFTGDETIAYDYINSYLTLAAGLTIRGQYTTDANTLKGYHTCLNHRVSGYNWTDWASLPIETCGVPGTPITPPSGLTLVTWNKVAEQIWNELVLAQAVSDYYADLLALYNTIFNNEQSILTATAGTLYNESMDEKSVDATFEDLLIAPFALSSLGGDVAAAVGGILSALIVAGVDASGDDNFQGTWSDAQHELTAILGKYQHIIPAGKAFVSGDSGFLQYVAEQKTSGAWDPSNAWVTRSMLSEGQRQIARWIYQTLSPSVWKMYAAYFTMSPCERPPDSIVYYYVDDNAHQDCFRQIVGAEDSQLHNIMDPVSPSCAPTKENLATWEYGSCSIGEDKANFFLNRDGWKFRVKAVPAP
ncbi:MAG TPA: VCBS repeat-containing protein [Nitrospirales bacterium]|nr:VCBS repeat-containing protein [Nitrospirales bacterium]